MLHSNQLKELPVSSVIQTAESPTNVRNISTCKERQILCLSVTQIVIGIICIVLNSILIIHESEDWSHIGHGIWGGAAFIATGFIGLLAVKCKSPCMIPFVAISSIVTLAISIVVMSLGIFGTVVARTTLPWECKDYGETCPPYYNPTYELQVSLETAIAVLAGVNGLLLNIWCLIVCITILFKCCTIRELFNLVFNYIKRILHYFYQLLFDGKTQEAFDAQTVLGLSVTQIVLGFLCLLLNSIFWNLFFHGIWGGIVFAATGCIGVHAARRKTRCMISALRTSSIVTIVICVPVLTLAIVTEVIDSWDSRSIALNTFMAIFVTTCGLLALWNYVICLKTLGQSFGCMLYYGYQPLDNGTSHALFVPPQDQKQDQATFKRADGSPIYYGIGFSFPIYKPATAAPPATSVEPPPYIAPINNTPDVTAANLPTDGEQVAVTITVQE